MNKINLTKIPNSAGVYFFRNAQNKIIYIGKAANLKNRLRNYFQKLSDLDFKTKKMLDQAAKVDFLQTDSEIEALILEAEMINRYKPRYNVRYKDDKSYLNIGISWSEDYPRVCYFRRPNLQDKKMRYFGPYTSSDALKRAMRYLRRIFPYRTCGKIPHRPCLFYQMYKIPAPCDETMPKKEYRKIIAQLMMFLRGKKKELIKKLKKEMKVLSAAKKFEQAAVVRNRLFALEHLHRAIIASDMMGLIKVPKRIECYDISNITGQDATGSMVTFTNGEKDTDQYRRFKIRTVPQANDIAMLAEVLHRRFKHSHKPYAISHKLFWPLPNLIIIDGGQAQLNIARKIILEQVQIPIPIISIAKGSDRKGEKLFFAGQKVLIDINLIKRIRDEAHRFAILYHKILRRKKIFGEK